MTFDPLKDLFDGLNTDASDVFERKRPCVGTGIYLLVALGPKQTEKGIIIQADLMVAKPAPGSTRKPGDTVELAWFTYKGKKEGGDNEKARAREFVNALLGLPKGTHSGAQAYRLSQPDQPGAGIAIAIKGEDVTYIRKSDKTTQTARNFEFTNIPQTAEQIASQRAQMTTMLTSAAASQPAAPAPAPAPVQPVAPPPVVPAAPAAPAASSPLDFLFK